MRLPTRTTSGATAMGSWRPARRLGRWWSLTGLVTLGWAAFRVYRRRCWSLGGLVTLGWAAFRAYRRLDRHASRHERTAGEPAEGDSLTFETKPESRFQDRDEAHKAAARYD